VSYLSQYGFLQSQQSFKAIIVENQGHTDQNVLKGWKHCKHELSPCCCSYFQHTSFRQNILSLQVIKDTLVYS